MDSKPWISRFGPDPVVVEDEDQRDRHLEEVRLTINKMRTKLFYLETIHKRVQGDLRILFKQAVKDSLEGP